MRQYQLMEKVRQLATIDRRQAERAAKIAEQVEHGYIIELDRIHAFNAERSAAVREMYREVSGDESDPFLTIDGNEVWVDKQFLAAFYDVQELPFALSYEAYWRYAVKWKGADETERKKSEKTVRLFETREYVALEHARAYVTFMTVHPAFLELCDKQNEEHFLDLVTLTASRSIQEFLFARATDAFRYFRLGGVLVDC